MLGFMGVEKDSYNCACNSGQFKLADNQMMNKTSRRG
jgi:hypothetical protein